MTHTDTQKLTHSVKVPIAYIGKEGIDFEGFFVFARTCLTNINFPNPGLEKLFSDKTRTTRKLKIPVDRSNEAPNSHSGPAGAAPLVARILIDGPDVKNLGAKGILFYSVVVNEIIMFYRCHEFRVFRSFLRDQQIVPNDASRRFINSNHLARRSCIGDMRGS